MIKVGQKKRAKYWGDFTVSKVVNLKNPTECQSEVVGKALFNPTMVKIEWQKPPSDDKNDIWFPYWIAINGKEKYGQFAPMIGEKALLELLQGAIQQDFFSPNFLSDLKNTLEQKLSNS